MTTAERRDAELLADRERPKLQKALGVSDLILFASCAIVGLDTLSFTAAGGGQAVTWLCLSFFFFLIPYGLLTAELGAAFPVEGAPYEWVKLAFGRFWGAVSAVLYWIAVPIWIGGTLSATAIAVINAFVLEQPAGKVGEIILGLVFTWSTIGVAIVSIRTGKWVPNIGLVIKAVLILFFGCLVVVYLMDVGVTGTVSAGDLRPTTSGFLAVIGVVMFKWIGFDAFTGASEEMLHPQKDIPRAIVRSGLIAGGLYAALLAGILFVIPEREVSVVTGFIDAYARVAGVLGGAQGPIGDLVGILIVLTLFVSGATWAISSTRVQAIAAWDGAAPAWMGRFTDAGTPAAMTIVSGVIASLFVILVLSFSSGGLASFFLVMISLVISTTAVGYILTFPALPILRKRYPEVVRPYRVPGGTVGCWICALLTEAVAVVTAVTLLWPGAIDSLLGNPYSIERNWGVSRLFFETVTLTTFAATMLIGAIFWMLGTRDRRRGLTGETMPGVRRSQVGSRHSI